MKKFEYKIERIILDKKLTNILNKAGQEGWRAVQYDKRILRQETEEKTFENPKWIIEILFEREIFT